MAGLGEREGWGRAGREGRRFFLEEERGGDSPTSLPSASGWQRPISLPSASGWQMAKRWGYWAVTASSSTGPHPLLCHLPVDKKDSLPSAGRWQRGGLIGRYSTGVHWTPPTSLLSASERQRFFAIRWPMAKNWLMATRFFVVYFSKRMAKTFFAIRWQTAKS